MRKKSERIISFILSLAMVVTMMPMNGLAAEGDPPEGTPPEGTLEESVDPGEKAEDTIETQQPTTLAEEENTTPQPEEKETKEVVNGKLQFTITYDDENDYFKYRNLQGLDHVFTLQGMDRSAYEWEVVGDPEKLENGQVRLTYSTKEEYPVTGSYTLQINDMPGYTPADLNTTEEGVQNTIPLQAGAATATATNYTFTLEKYKVTGSVWPDEGSVIDEYFSQEFQVIRDNDTQKMFSTPDPQNHVFTYGENPNGSWGYQYVVPAKYVTPDLDENQNQKTDENGTPLYKVESASYTVKENDKLKYQVDGDTVQDDPQPNYSQDAHVFTKVTWIGDGPVVTKEDDKKKIDYGTYNIIITVGKEGDPYYREFTKPLNAENGYQFIFDDYNTQSIEQYGLSFTKEQNTITAFYELSKLPTKLSDVSKNNGDSAIPLTYKLEYVAGPEKSDANDHAEYTITKPEENRYEIKKNEKIIASNGSIENVKIQFPANDIADKDSHKEDLGTITLTYKVDGENGYSGSIEVPLTENNDYKIGNIPLDGNENGTVFSSDNAFTVSDPVDGVYTLNIDNLPTKIIGSDGKVHTISDWAIGTAAAPDGYTFDFYDENNKTFAYYVSDGFKKNDAKAETTIVWQDENPITHDDYGTLQITCKIPGYKPDGETGADYEQVIDVNYTTNAEGKKVYTFQYQNPLNPEEKVEKQIVFETDNQILVDAFVEELPEKFFCDGKDYDVKWSIGLKEDAQPEGYLYLYQDQENNTHYLTPVTTATFSVQLNGGSTVTDLQTYLEQWGGSIALNQTVVKTNEDGTVVPETRETLGYLQYVDNKWVVTSPEEKTLDYAITPTVTEKVVNNVKVYEISVSGMPQFDSAKKEYMYNLTATTVSQDKPDNQKISNDVLEKAGITNQTEKDQYNKNSILPAYQNTILMSQFDKDQNFAGCYADGTLKLTLDSKSMYSMTKQWYQDVDSTYPNTEFTMWRYNSQNGNYSTASAVYEKDIVYVSFKGDTKVSESKETENKSVVFDSVFNHEKEQTPTYAADVYESETHWVLGLPTYNADGYAYVYLVREEMESTVVLKGETTPIGNDYKTHFYYYNLGEDGNPIVSDTPIDSDKPYTGDRSAADQSIYNGSTVSNFLEDTQKESVTKKWIAGEYQDKLYKENDYKVVVEFKLQCRNALPTVAEEAEYKADPNEGWTDAVDENGKPYTVYNSAGFIAERLSQTLYKEVPQFSKLSRKQEYRWVESGVYLELAEKSVDNKTQYTDKDGNTTTDKEQANLLNNDNTFTLPGITQGDDTFKSEVNEETGVVTNSVVGKTQYVVEKYWDLQKADTSTKEVEIELHQVTTTGVDSVFKRGKITDISKAAPYEGEGGTTVFTNLPKYDESGNKYTYYAVETTTGYNTTYQYNIKLGDSNTTYTQLNSYKDTNDEYNNAVITNSNGDGGETWEIKVRKVWLDDGNTSARKPAKIEILAGENEDVIKTVTLSEKNNWQDVEVSLNYPADSGDWTADQKTAYRNSVQIREAGLAPKENETCTYNVIPVGGTLPEGSLKSDYNYDTVTTDSNEYEVFYENQINDGASGKDKYKILNDASRLTALTGTDQDNDGYYTIYNRRIGEVQIHIQSNWLDGLKYYDALTEEIQKEILDSRQAANFAYQLKDDNGNVFTFNGKNYFQINDLIEGNTSGTTAPEKNWESVTTDYTYKDTESESGSSTAKYSTMVVKTENESSDTPSPGFTTTYPKYDENGAVIHYSVNVYENGQSKTYAYQEQEYVRTNSGNSYEKGIVTDTATFWFDYKKESTKEVNFYKEWHDAFVFENGNRPDIYLSLYYYDYETDQLVSKYVGCKWTKHNTDDDRYITNGDNDNKWQCTFINLDKYDESGREIFYYASEKSAANSAAQDYADPTFKYKDQDVTIETGALDGETLKPVYGYGTGEALKEGGTFVNNLQGTVSIKGKKVWENVPKGFDTRDLPTLQFILYQRIKDDTSAENEWKEIAISPQIGSYTESTFYYTFEYKGKNTISGEAADENFVVLPDQTAVEKLPKYNAEGKLYEYEIREKFIGVEQDKVAQVVEAVGNQSNTYTIVNSFKTGQVTAPGEDGNKVYNNADLVVTKNWNLPSWMDSSQCVDVTYAVYQFYTTKNEQGKEVFTTPILVGEKTLTNYDASTNKSVTFEGLPVHTPAFKDYYYFVVEKPIDGFTITETLTDVNTNKTLGTSYTKETWYGKYLNDRSQIMVGGTAVEDIACYTAPFTLEATATKQVNNISYTNKYGEQTVNSEFIENAVKVWDDYDNAFNTRPDSIRMTLKRSAEASEIGGAAIPEQIVGDVVLTKQEDGTLSGSFEAAEVPNSGTTPVTQAIGDVMQALSEEMGANTGYNTRAVIVTPNSSYADREWKYTLTQLDEYAPNGSKWDYTLTEAVSNRTETVDGTDTEIYKVSNVEKGVKNTLVRTSHKAVKKWEDINNVKRPEVQFELQVSLDGGTTWQKASTYMSASGYTEFVKTLVSGVEEVTFNNLPMYAKVGEAFKKLQYRAVEIKIGEDDVENATLEGAHTDIYTVLSETNNGTTTITNTLRNPRSLTVTKVFEGDEDNLFESREGGTNWIVKFQIYVAYEGGQKLLRIDNQDYLVSIESKKFPETEGDTRSYTDNDENVITETKDSNGKKTYSIQLNNLPGKAVVKDEQGNEKVVDCTYFAKEVTGAANTTVGDDNYYNGTYGATSENSTTGSNDSTSYKNTLNPTEIKIVKNWVDDEMIIRPKSLPLRIFQNGKDITDDYLTYLERQSDVDSKETYDWSLQSASDKIHYWKKTGENQWTYTFYNLPETDKNGRPYYYTIKEDHQTGYEQPVYTSSTVDGNLVWTIENKAVAFTMSKVADGMNISTPAASVVDAVNLAVMTMMSALTANAEPNAENEGAVALSEVQVATIEELKNAINNATGVTTIRLTTNMEGSITIPEDKNIILDLNGQTLSSSGTTIINNGTLKVVDQSSGASGKIVSTGNCGIAAGSNSVTTFESGTIESVEGAIITGKSTGATINVTGGTLNASDNAVIAGNGTERTGKENTINISGGTLNGQIKTSGYIACGIYAPWKDIINISGGTINVTNGAGIVARAGTVNITGGSINASGTVEGWVGDNKNELPSAAIVYDQKANYPAQEDGAKITITGGTFQSDGETVSTITEDSQPATNRVEITGGTFSETGSVQQFVPATSEGENTEIIGGQVVQVKNINPNVEITLTGAETGNSGYTAVWSKNTATGAESILVTKDGTRIYYAVSTAVADETVSPVVIKCLPVGTYNIEETKSPDGYEIPTVADAAADKKLGTLTIGADGSVSGNHDMVGITAAGADTYANVAITNVPVAISFAKIDAADKQKLAGAVFQLTGKFVNLDDDKLAANNITKTPSADDNATLEWTSTTKEMILSGVFKVGETYTLTEIKAPDEYRLSNDGTMPTRTFRVNADGTIAWETGGNETQIKEVEASNQRGTEAVQVETANSKIDVVLKKTDWAGGSLTGAEFKFYKLGEMEEANKKTITVDSEGGISLAASGVPLKYGQTYVLEETKAPDGYILPTNLKITFTIAEDGTVIAQDAAQNPFKCDVTAGTGEASLTTDNKALLSTITVKNKPIELKFGKVSSQNYGTTLSGYTYSLTGKFAKTTAPENATMSAADGEGVATITWTKADTDLFELSAYLVANETYTLSEIKAPNGYELTSDVTFRVNADGKIEFAGTVNDSVYEDNAAGEKPFTGKPNAYLTNETEAVPRQTLTLRDDPIILKLDKYNLVTDDINATKVPLPGAKFTITGKFADNPDTETTKEIESSENLSIAGMDAQFIASYTENEYVYTVEETNSPAGYEAIKFEFTINKDGTIQRVTKLNSNTANDSLASDSTVEKDSDTINVNDARIEMSLKKTDLAGNDIEADATDFAIFKISGKFHEAGQKDVYVSNNPTPSTFKGYEVVKFDSLNGKWLVGEKYTIQEVYAPDGYKLRNAEVEFYFNKYGNLCSTKDGNVYTDTTFTKVDATDKSKLVFADEPISLEVLKVSVIKPDGQNAKKLQGATFKIQEKDNESNYAELTSDEDGVISITKEVTDSNGHTLVLKYGKTYTITETKAPDGYILPYNQTRDQLLSVEFSIDADGNIPQGDSNVTVNGSAGTGFITFVNNSNLITVVNQPIEVTFDKASTEDGNKKLANFKYEIRPAQDGDKFAISKDADSLEVTDTIQNQKVLSEELIYGHDYILTETQTPYGYEKAADVKFRVNSDGTVTLMNGDAEVTDYLSFRAFLEAENKTLVLKDTPIEISLDKYVANADGTGESKDDKYQDAVFTVSGKFADGNGKLIDETVDKTGIKAKNFASTLKSLLVTGQTYEVTETTPPAGYEAIHFKFSIDPDGNGTIVGTDGTALSTETDSISGSTVIKLDADTLKVIDTKTSLNLRKVEKVGEVSVTDNTSAETVGADYAIVKVTGDFADGAAGTYYVSNGKNFKDELPTVDGTKLTIADIKLFSEMDGKWIAGNTYTFTEVYAPAGYKLNGESVDVTFDLYGNITENKTFTAATGETFVFGNEPIQFNLLKVTSATGKAGLSGAVFTLQEKGKEPAVTKTVDSDTGITLGKTVSDGTNTITLQYGHTYVLTETKAPDGYTLPGLLGEDNENANLLTMTFTIDESGQIITSGTGAFAFTVESGTGSAEATTTDGTSTITVQNNPIDITFDKESTDEVVGEATKDISNFVYEIKPKDGSKFASGAESISVDDLGTTANVFDYIRAELVYDNTYIITETTEPNGYEKITNTVEFTVKKDGTVRLADGTTVAFLDGSNKEVTLQDEPIIINLAKQDLEGHALEGSVFEVTGEFADGKGNISNVTKIENLTVANFATELKAKLVAGKEYTVTETTAPIGYELANFKFIVTNEGKIQTATPVLPVNGVTGETTETLTVKDSPIEIRVTKVSEGGTSSIENKDGSDYAVFKVDGEFVTTLNGTARAEATYYVSNQYTGANTGTYGVNTVQSFESLNGLWIAGNDYTFTEIYAPDGYELQKEPVVVTVQNNGTIVEKEDKTFVQAGGETLIFEDTPIQISLKKVGFDGTAQTNLKNADFEFYVNDVLKGTVTIDNTDGITWTKTASYKTGVDTTESIVLKYGNTYKLVEKKAPDGYILPGNLNGETMDNPLTIEFKITDKGEIVNKDDAASLYTVGKNSDKETGKAEIETGNTSIKITNYPTKMNFKKISSTDAQAKDLTGYEFKVTGIFASADGTRGTAAETLTVTDTASLPIAKLIAGEQYTVTETKAPAGYELAANVTFTVQKDGSITYDDSNTGETVYDLTGKVSGETDYVEQDTGFVTTDVTSGVHRDTLTIRDDHIADIIITKSGVHVDGTTPATEAEKNENATFVITGKFANGQGTRTYTTGTNPNNAINAADLVAGETYTVKETIVPDGYEAIEFKFYVNTDGTITTKGQTEASEKGGSSFVIESGKIQQIKVTDMQTSLSLTKVNVFAGSSIETANDHAIFKVSGTFAGETGEQTKYVSNEACTQGTCTVHKEHGEAAGNTIVTFASLNGKWIAKNSYIFTEVYAPAGYERNSTDVTVTFDEYGNVETNQAGFTQVVNNPNDSNHSSGLEFKNEKISFTLKKQSNDTTPVILKNAEFNLYESDADGNKISESTPVEKVTVTDGTITFTEKQGNITFQYGHIYTLEETKAPDGYILPGTTNNRLKVTFKISPEGNLVPAEEQTLMARILGVLTGNDMTFDVENGSARFENGKTEITVTDHPIEITFDKVNEDGTTDIKGFVYTVKPADEANGYFAADDGRQLAEKSITVTDSDSGRTDLTATFTDVISKRLVYGQSYIVEETAAPHGFERTRDKVQFKVNNDGTIAIEKVLKNGTTEDTNDTEIAKVAYLAGNGMEFILKDTPITVDLAKYDLLDEGLTTELTGAVFKVEGTFADAAKGSTSTTPIENVTADNIVTELKGKLIVGNEYTVTETTAPLGYEVTKFTFKVTDEGNIVSTVHNNAYSGDISSTNDKLIVKDKKISMTLRKVSTVDTAVPIENETSDHAVFAITGDFVGGTRGDDSPYYVSNGTTAYTDHTTDLFSDLDGQWIVGKEYTIKEVYAPAGYKRQKAELKITFNEKGEMSIVGTSDFASVKETNKEELVFQNEPISITVLKVESQIGGTPLPLARFTLYDETDSRTSGTLISDVNGKVYLNTVDPSVSGNVNDRLLLKYNHTYTLKETQAPAGYIRPWVGSADGLLEIKFKVNDDGQLEAVDANGLTFEGANSSGSASFADKGTEITVVNKPIAITFNKVNAENDSTQLTGFKYEVKPVAPGAFATGETSITVTANDTKLSGKFIYGNVYEIKETQAPRGYKLLQGSRYFKVLSDGTVITCDQNGNASTEAYLALSGDGKGVNLKNDPIEISLSKKNETGADLSGAEFTISGEQFADTKGEVKADETQITGITVENINAKLKGKLIPGVVYTMEETTRPVGYEGIAFTFKVDASGNIIELAETDASQAGASTVSATDAALTVTDKPVQIDLLKTDGTTEIDSDDDSAVFEVTGKFANNSATEVTRILSNGALYPGYTVPQDKTVEKFADLNTNKQWIAGETYTFKEVHAPAGYKLNGTEFHVVVDEYGNLTVNPTKTFVAIEDKATDQAELIKVTNEAINVKLKKVGGNDEPLSGAEFSFYEKGKEPKVTVTTTGADGSVDLKGKGITLTYGHTYVLEETKAPDGFELDATPIEFTLNSNGTIGDRNEARVGIATADGVSTITVTNTPIELTLTKVSSTDVNKKLANAEFTLSNGANEATVTSDENGVITLKEKEGDITLKYGDDTTYTLTETKAPAGYKKWAGSVEFKIASNGTIELVGTPSLVTVDNADKSQMTMENEPIQITFTKNVSGAEFTITPETGKTFADGKSDPMTGVTSSTDLTGKLLPNVIYTMEETKIPDGYEGIKFTFKVDEYGAIVEAPVVEDGYEGTAVVDGTDTSKLVITDVQTSIKLKKKLSATGTSQISASNPVKFTLSGDFVGEKDSYEFTVDSVTTEFAEVDLTSVTGKMIVGNEYTLTEASPQGFKPLAGALKIKLDAKGNIEIIVNEDATHINVAGDTIEVTNDPTAPEIVGATLFIENTIGVNFYVDFGGTAVEDGKLEGSDDKDTKYRLENITPSEISQKYKMRFYFMDQSGNYISGQTAETEFNEYAYNFLTDEKGNVRPIFRGTYWCQAYNMADYIVAVLIDKDTEKAIGKGRKYSIKTYADAMKVKPDSEIQESQKGLQEMLKAMLDYGAASQIYAKENGWGTSSPWGVQTTNLANGDTYYNDFSKLENIDPKHSMKLGTDNIKDFNNAIGETGLTVNGISLTINEGASISMKMYVKVADDKIVDGGYAGESGPVQGTNPIKIMMGNVDLGYQWERLGTAKNGSYSVNIDNIPVYRWDDRFAFDFGYEGDSNNRHNINYSVLSYVYNMLEKNQGNIAGTGNGSFNNLLKSMYYFNEKANSYRKFVELQNYENDNPAAEKHYWTYESNQFGHNENGSVVQQEVSDEN